MMRHTRATFLAADPDHAQRKALRILKKGALPKGWTLSVDDPPGPGDAMLLSIPCNGKPNHCGVYMGGGQILHHLRGRLSREEHLGPLHRAVTSVMRRCA